MQDVTHPEAGWEQGVPLWSHVGQWGPWLLAAGALVVLARAVVRRHRYRAVDVLGEAEQERVHAAIRAAEQRTVGEILPVVVERSDPHPGAAWVCALATLVLGSTLLVTVLPWDDPPLLLLAQLGLGALGFAAARALPDLAHVFVPAARADAVCAEQALLEFHANGLAETEAATGVLLFVSLLEHRVVVLGDSGIDAVVPAETWRRVTDVTLRAVARGDVAGGLVAGVEAAGDVLAEHFPWVEGDRNELPDRLVVRRE